jgi:hypothetical protein
MTTLAEQIACVQREIQMRQRVYPGLIDRRKMRPEAADREIETMVDVERSLVILQQIAAGLPQHEKTAELLKEMGLA